MTRVDHRGVIAVPSPPVLVGAPRLTSTPTAFPTIDGATPDSVLDGGSTGRLVVRAASVRGDDHRFYGETRQDAFGIRAIRTPAGDEILIVCVADGVGSEPMSHVGARKVCGRLAAGLAPVAESLLTGPPDQRFGHMVATAIRELAGILTAEARSRSIEPERLSTTVTCALIAMSADGVGRVAWFRVGDSEAFTLRAWPSTRCSTAGPEPLPRLGPRHCRRIQSRLKLSTAMRCPATLSYSALTAFRLALLRSPTSSVPGGTAMCPIWPSSIGS